MRPLPDANEPSVREVSLVGALPPDTGRDAGTDTEETHIAYWKRPDPGPGWRGWLTRAAGDASGLRRWRFWIWWSGQETPRARASAALGLLLSPLVTMRNARGCVQRCGGKVLAQYGIKPRRQLWQILRLAFGAGLPPVAYYKYQLFLPERRTQAHQYVEDAGRFLLVLASRVPPAPDAQIGGNKRVFALWCREHGLPVVGDLLEVNGDRVTRHCVTLPSTDLFSKPENWRAGKGVEKWRHIAGNGESRWQGREGDALDFSELERRLSARSREYGRPLVLQPFLVNHPAIAALGGSALCTLRVMTVRRHPGSAEALLAVLRIGTGDAPADNFDLGGLATAVDLQTGRCSKAITKRGDYPVDRLPAHPDTGAKIEGFELPHWREAIDLAVRAHQLLQFRVPVMGWDVAILADGPVLIEANRFPGGNIAQMPTGLPLGASAFAPSVVEALKTGFNVR